MNTVSLCPACLSTEACKCQIEFLQKKQEEDSKILTRAQRRFLKRKTGEIVAARAPYTFDEFVKEKKLQRSQYGVKEGVKPPVAKTDGAASLA